MLGTHVHTPEHTHTQAHRHRHTDTHTQSHYLHSHFKHITRCFLIKHSEDGGCRCGESTTNVLRPLIKHLHVCHRSPCCMRGQLDHQKRKAHKSTSAPVSVGGSRGRKEITARARKGRERARGEAKGRENKRKRQSQEQRTRATNPTCCCFCCCLCAVCYTCNISSTPSHQ